MDDGPTSISATGFRVARSMSFTRWLPAASLEADRAGGGEQLAVGREVEGVEVSIDPQGIADALVSAGVEQDERPIESSNGEDPVVGAQRQAAGP